MTALKDAAIRQALDALLDDHNKLVQISEHHWESKRDLAVIALHAALAEPVQGPQRGTQLGTQPGTQRGPQRGPQRGMQQGTQHGTPNGRRRPIG